MIRINLINKSTVSAQPSVGITDSGDLILSQQELQKQALVKALIVVIFPAAVYLIENNVLIPNMNRQISSFNSELAKLQEYNKQREPSVNEIKKYEEERTKIEKKIKLLHTISNERGRELALHRFFQKVIPEKTWFNEYAYDQLGDRIVIRGQTYGPSEIQRLREDVQGNVMFKTVEITRQGEAKFQNQVVEEFELNIGLEKNSESSP